jgi:hypothetical protein
MRVILRPGIFPGEKYRDCDARIRQPAPLFSVRANITVADGGCRILRVGLGVL